MELPQIVSGTTPVSVPEGDDEYGRVTSGVYKQPQEALVLRNATGRENLHLCTNEMFIVAGT